MTGPAPAGLADQLKAMAAMLHPAIMADCQQIADADADRLTRAEAEVLAGSVPSVRRASGTARVVARRLLAAAGTGSDFDLVPDRTRGPAWPPGFVGSMTHDDAFAAAAVAPAASLRGLGIDIEPAAPLPAEIYQMVVTPAEDHRIGADLLCARLLFVIKEAVYKTTHPVDGVFLDHHDVEVDLDTGSAVTRTGHRLRFEAAVVGRLLAIATFEDRALARR